MRPALKISTSTFIVCAGLSITIKTVPPYNGTAHLMFPWANWYGNPLGDWPGHSGLVSRIIRDLDSVRLYVVKVTGSSGWIGTVCNQSNMENGWSLQIILLDSALDTFTSMTVSQKLRVSKLDYVHFSPVHYHMPGYWSKKQKTQIVVLRAGNK